MLSKPIRTDRIRINEWFVNSLQVIYSLAADEVV